MLLMLKLRAQYLLGTRDEMFAFLGKVSPAAAGQPCLPAFCPGGRWSVMPANERKQETHTGHLGLHLIFAKQTHN